MHTTKLDTKEKIVSTTNHTISVYLKNFVAKFDVLCNNLKLWWSFDYILNIDGFSLLFFLHSNIFIFYNIVLSG